MPATEGQPQGNETQDRKVLLVEDSEELRELYESALKNEGYQVQAASLAEPALEIARTWRPEVVLTDLFMPGMGGMELITRIRSDLTPPLPRIIVISGFPGARSEALKRGAERFETKPITFEELLSVVQDAFAPERACRQRAPDVVEQRRAATRTIGEATLARHLTADPHLISRVNWQVKVLARFFEHATLLVFLLREGKLKVVASSSPEFPVGAEAADVLPVVDDVVESDVSLVVSNGSAHWLPGSRMPSTTGSVAAVPYSIHHEVVGALCFVDAAPHHVDSAKLGILEYLARRGAAMTVGGPRIMDDSGLFDGGTLGAILRGSLFSNEHEEHALGFTVVDVARVPRDGTLANVLFALPAPAMTAGIVGPSRVAAFAFAENPAQVRVRLEAARRLLARHVKIVRASELTYEVPVPHVDLDTLLVRARDLLVRAGFERRTFIAIDAHRREPPTGTHPPDEPSSMVPSA